MFDKIFPFITLVIGFFLGELRDYLLQRKDDQKKLNKLLFNLLQIRGLLKEKTESKNRIDSFYKHFYIKFKDIIGTLPDKEKGIVEKSVKDGITDYLLPFKNNISQLEDNISFVIHEISETDPIFAHDIMVNYNITVPLKS